MAVCPTRSSNILFLAPANPSSITPEMFAKATKVTVNGEHLSIVENEHEAKEYRVHFNRQYGKLTCPAGERGINCKHKRAAMAAEIEAQECYRFGQTMVELENVLDKLDEIAARSTVLA